MKYIRIKNNGVIEPQALHLVGATTKRDQKNKIGQFGSGNKYALAYFIRNGYDVKIFAGTNEITVETKTETFRGQDFSILHINGEKTSITTDMGKDWQFWQAIREIYCNAIDEGGFGLDYVQNVEPEEGKTHFYINVKKDVNEFVTNFDNYFSHNKKVLFECEYGRILEKSGETANIYRRGIRCFDSNKNSIYDYDFKNIEVDENRLIKYFWQIEEKIWSLIYLCTNKEVIMNVLHNSANQDYLESCVSDISSIGVNSMSEEFKECVRSTRVAPLGMSGMLAPDEINNHVIIPTKVFTSLRGVLSDDNVGKRFQVTRNNEMFREIELTELHKATLDKAMEFFKECGFNIPYPIHIGIFDNKKIGGAAHDGKIYVSDIGLERGVNQVIVILIEEYVHLKYDCYDETREFQTAIITELVTYMKTKNAFLA